VERACEPLLRRLPKGVSWMVWQIILAKHTPWWPKECRCALANVDDETTGKFILQTLCAGGQYLNNGAWTSCLLKKPLTGWKNWSVGCCLWPNPWWANSSAKFWGHKYPRLAHVGDRTGLEMIRTLQDHGIHQGINIYQEYTITSLVERWWSYRWRLWLW